MTTTSTVAFRFSALPAEVLHRVRAGGVDALGNVAVRVRAEGGDPLRCCLRDAEPGADLLLFGYQPPLPGSPYREVGAVLAHAEPCAGPADAHTYPPHWRGRPQVLRAYDARGWIHDATVVHDGSDPEAAIARVLADPDVVQVHSRNIAWGCYMFTITRAE
jgi:uncharacterized protein DUF1203